MATHSLGILILGMHRSGTSLASRLINLMGAALPEALLGPTPSNEAGHWESERVYDLNEAFLRDIESSWSDWTVFERGPETAVARDRLIDRGVAFLQQELVGKHLFVLKDPRFCRLMPEWLEIFDRAQVEARVVLPLRNPLDVAASLFERGGDSPHAAMFLWLRHVLEAEVASRDLKRVFIRYGEVIDDWRGVVTKIARELTLDWPRTIPEISEQADDFVRRSRRHHDIGDEAFFKNSEVHHWLKRAYGLLQMLHTADGNAEVMQELDSLRFEFNAISGAARPAAVSNARLANENLVLKYRIGEVTGQVRLLTQQQDELEGRIAQRDHELDRLGTTLDSRRVKYSDALEELTLLTAANINLRDKTDVLSANARKLEVENGELQAHREDGLKRLSAMEAEIIALRQDLSAHEVLQIESQSLRREQMILQRDYTTLRSEYETLQSKYQRLENETHGLRAQVDQIPELRSESNALRKETGQLRRERDLNKFKAETAADAVRVSRAMARHRNDLYHAAKAIGKVQTIRLPFYSKAQSEGVSPDRPSRRDMRRIKRVIRNSGLFDGNWYRTAYPELEFIKCDPLEHYIVFGAFEGRDPGPYFQGQWYLSANPYLRRDGVNPLFHYIVNGAKYGLFPNLVFDTKFYLDAHPDVAAAGVNPLVHYVKHGIGEKRNINRDFDLATYAKVTSDLDASGMSPLEHLIRVKVYEHDIPAGVSHEVVEEIRSSSLFDSTYYRQQVPETDLLPVDPLFDYLVRGNRIGKNPHRLFDTDYYLAQHPDIADRGTNPFFHFIKFGAKNGSSPHPLFDAKYYLKRYPDIERAEINPLLHFIRHGWKGAYSPHRFFDAQWYIKTYPEVERSRRNPLLDYLINGQSMGRWPHPDFDPAYYLSVNPDVLAAGVDPFIHFVQWGEKEGRLNTARGRRFRVVVSVAPRQNGPVAGTIQDRNSDQQPYWYPPQWGRKISLLQKLNAYLKAPDAIPSEVLAVAREALEREPLSISVVMPAWNRAHVVMDAVESVLAQSYAVRELIIIDDGSSDSTLELIRSRCSGAVSDGRIKLLARTHEGLCASRNAGLDAAQGDLIAYLDTDNTWHRDYTLLMASVFALAPNLNTAYCGEHVHDIDKKSEEFIGEEFDRPKLVNRNYIDLNCFVHRRNLVGRLGGFDTTLTRLVDWDLIVRYTRYCPPAFVPVCLVDYYLDKSKLNNVTYSEGWQRNWEVVARSHMRERIKLGVIPLRIGYIVWDWPALSQTFVLNELRWLLAREFDVKVYYSVDPDRAVVLDFAIEAEKVASAEDLAAAVQRDRRTLLHSPFAYPATTLLTWPVAKLTGIPFTFMPGGVDICHHKNRLRNRVAEVSSDPLCLGLVTLGTFHRSLLADAGVPMNKLVMERQAVNLPSFKPRQRRRDRPKLIGVGRFVAKKGFEYLVEAASLLQDCDIFLFGYGPLEEDLRSQTRKLGATNVTFAGTLDSTQALHDAYFDADMLVLPCIEAPDGDMDGLPTVLLEAMASGLPVVTNRIANIPDLIVDGVFGFLAEPKQTGSLVAAIKQALDLSDADWRYLVTRAAKRARDYASDERMLTTLLSVWRSRSIDIVLVTYDTPNYANAETTIDIIDRIYAHTVLDFNLIVVDNGSQASFIDGLEERYGDRLNFNLIKLKKNIYVGPGTNLGIESGTSEYIVYLCSKEGFILQNGWDLQMVRAMDDNLKAGMGGYLISLPNYRNGEEYSSYPGFEKWRNQEFAKANPKRRMRHVQGGVLIIRRSVYNAVGGFSDAVPHNGTDIEYSYYLESEGYELLDIQNVYSLSSKTWPDAVTLVDENAVVVHPLTSEIAARYSSLSSSSGFQCNLCGFQGGAAEGGSHSIGCPSCKSMPFERSVMRHLSLSGTLQRRPKVVCVGTGAALRDALVRVCTASITMPFSAFTSYQPSRDEPEIIIIDIDMLAAEGEKDLEISLLRMASAGCCIVYGGEVTNVEALARNLHAGGLVAEKICSASNAISLYSKPLYGIGFPPGRELYLE